QRMAYAPIATGTPPPMIILIEAKTADVSSTAIRARCARGEPISGLVDQRVRQHIEQHGLYQQSVENRRVIEHPPNRAAGRLHAESRHRERGDTETDEGPKGGEAPGRSRPCGSSR